MIIYSYVYAALCHSVYDWDIFEQTLVYTLHNKPFIFVYAIRETSLYHIRSVWLSTIRFKLETVNRLTYIKARIECKYSSTTLLTSYYARYRRLLVKYYSSLTTLLYTDLIRDKLSLLLYSVLLHFSSNHDSIVLDLFNE